MKKKLASTKQETPNVENTIQISISSFIVIQHVIHTVFPFFLFTLS